MKLKLSYVLALGTVFVFGNAFAEDKAQENYLKHCKKCHAEDGTGKKDGNPLAVVKSLKLKDPEVLNLLRDEVAKAKDEELEKVILKGTKDMPGKEGKMKGLEDKLSAAEAKELVQYVRKLKKK